MKSDLNNYIKYGLVLFLTVVSFTIVKPYLTAIALSITLGYMAFPLQKWLKRKIKNETASAIILTVLLFLAIVIPVLLLTNALLNEAADVYRSTNIDGIKDILSTKFNLQIGETTQGYINSMTKTAAAFILTKVSELIFSIPNLLINFFILFCIIFFILRDGEKMYARILSLIPIEENYKKRFQKKLTNTIESLFYGTIALSIIEALIAMIGFYFLGVHSPILWGSVIGLTAILPGIGATAVWIPMAIISYLNGDVANAICLILFGFIILSTAIDTLLRAKILGLRAELHPLIIIIGVLGGLSAFGFIGMLIGPLILSLFELIIEIYGEMKDEA